MPQAHTVIPAEVGMLHVYVRRADKCLKHRCAGPAGITQADVPQDVAGFVS